MTDFVGGADKTAVVFQKDTEQIVATLKGHTKKVTGAVYHPREVSQLWGGSVGLLVDALPSLPPFILKLLYCVVGDCYHCLA